MEYQLAQETWKDAQVTSIYAADGRFLAEFPISFVRRGGVDTWTYVLDVLSQLLESMTQPRLLNANREAVSPDDKVEAGDFTLQVDESSVSFSRGPEYFRKGIAPNTEAGQSTRSRSKSRSTPNQSNFRFFVSVRDSQCLVTGAEAENCTAAHIIPQSRPDLYQKVLNLRRNPPIFSPSSGILLEDALHRAWDRLQLSFYYYNEVYYVHFFDRDLPGADDFHGKAIHSTRFHTRSSKHPDPRLINWHYRQCAMARIRGFASGMEIAATSAAAMEQFR